MLILKLGGAAITDKNQLNTARPDALQQIAKTIATAPQPMVIVHGAGSFGHIIAKEHHLQNGYQDKIQLSAFVELQRQLHRLNQLVVNALIDAGLLAIAVQPLAFTTMTKKRMSKTFWEGLRGVLDHGMVPVVYGDCVFDSDQGFGILSGDQLMRELAILTHARTVAFGTNVAGVLDSEGHPMPQYTIGDQIDTISAARVDVTGGMQGKLDEIAAIPTQTRVWIFDLNNLSDLAQIMSGAGAGTEIMRTPKE